MEQNAVIEREKVFRAAPAPVKSVGTDSSSPAVKSFSKFDGQ